MKTELMRKDPLQLMEYILEMATAMSTADAATAAEQRKTSDLEATKGSDRFRRRGFGSVALSGFLAV